MTIEIIQTTVAAALHEYTTIPIAFTVTQVLDDEALDHLELVERSIAAPYVKDYDTVEGDAPTAWACRFDLSKWVALLARANGGTVGATAVAFDTPGVELLEGRRDLAVLWDFRVAPPARGQGIGAALLRAAARWAVGAGCRELKVETQNINVPACRFYERQSFRLRAANRNAYPELPHEIQLLWYKDLGPDRRDGLR